MIARASRPDGGRWSVALRLGLIASLLGLAACDAPGAFEAGRPGSGDADLAPLPPQPEGVPWPSRAWPRAELAPQIDRAALDAATDALFEPTGRGGISDTRALLIVHRGEVVHERYAPGFGASSRFHSWSVAKSFTNAIVGILVRQGRLDIDAPTDVPAWQREPGDPRAAITLRNLLQMSSGLDHGDSSAASSSVVSRMLFGDKVGYMAEFAADVPLAHPPGVFWEYATPTSSIVADVAQRAIGADRDSMRAFMRRQLFEPLGIESAVAEFDLSGHYIGGVAVHASARDYARIGLLFLRDGIWDGRRILPEGWVDFSRTRAPPSNNGNYAAHFWLSNEPAPGQFPSLVGAPPSTFSANGNEGQFIAMVPSHDLVVVRLGVLHGSSWVELSDALIRVIDPFPARESAHAGVTR